MIVSSQQSICLRSRVLYGANGLAMLHLLARGLGQPIRYGVVADVGGNSTQVSKDAFVAFLREWLIALRAIVYLDLIVDGIDMLIQIAKSTGISRRMGCLCTAAIAHSHVVVVHAMLPLAFDILEAASGVTEL